MTYKNENQIKMVLGLNAWRNLLQDKTIRFAQLMTEMDTTVMMRLSGELPQLREFARQTLGKLDKVAASTDNPGLAGAHIQNEHSWFSTSQQIKKIIALDYFDGLSNDLAKSKSVLLDSIALVLEESQDLFCFDEQFLRALCKRNQDSIRSFTIAILVYVGGCLNPPTSDYESK